MLLELVEEESELGLEQGGGGWSLQRWGWT